MFDTMTVPRSDIRAPSQKVRQIAAARIVPIVAALIAVPLSLGVIRGFEINAAFALAPLIAVLYFQSLKDPLNLAFAAAAVGGAISIVAGHLLGPNHLIGNIEGLLFGSMFAPSFMFLGRALAERYSLKTLVMWLAFWSAIFLIVITLPILFWDEPVRGVTKDGHSFINVLFFGLPVFASYGVNSLAPLFALQAALICGALVASNNWFRLLFAAGLACAIFLVVGSESRTAQLTLVIFIPAVAWFAFRWTPSRRPTAIIAAIIVLAATGATMTRVPGEMRLVSSLVEVSNSVTTAAPSGKSTEPKREEVPEKQNYEGVTTGRWLIWRAAFSEWLEHPLIGVSFAGFGRYSTDPLPLPLQENSTAHFYYLNILWKGGLVFAIPFAAMMLIAARAAFARHDYPAPAVRYFAGVAVFMTFTLPAIFWDILMVPSAGALAWFLLGALGRRETHA